MDSFGRRTFLKQSVITGLTAALGVSPSHGTDLSTANTLTEQPGYLPNPGIGYQGWTYATGLYTSSVEYRRGPHRDQGGFDWATLNPARGTYNWAPVDTFLDTCAARGGQGSFRILTMLGWGDGGHCVPAWVLAQGAVIAEGGDRGDEPDYRNRHYQTQWGQFIQALADRYDGDPRIAFIDISGYGLYNEWQANHLTTHEDADSGLSDSVDSSTRRHLVHCFVGGTGTARCVETDGSPGAFAYSYRGFTQTQLLMPYSGTPGTTRWVLDTFPHVGFRNDGLFSQWSDLSDYQWIGHGIQDRWKTAPVVLEAVGGRDQALYYARSAEALRGIGASIMHENGSLTADPELAALLAPLGYRYMCTQTRTSGTVRAGGRLVIETTWTNTGTAKSYPRMGQDFMVALALADTTGAVIVSWVRDRQVSDWLPGKVYVLRDDLTAPATKGRYTLLIGIFERNTGRRIQLPLPRSGRADGWYPAGTLTIT